ncbi:endonuclease/exonuclease/phosphatase family protein [Nocardioides sp. C4-1]|uniref:endonuclease/exonuclease/phosphatase family protein n=1 Tax=Nocardioides sp. C4-1 TaxID=3151851 RepID=UPI0032652D74
MIFRTARSLTIAVVVALLLGGLGAARSAATAGPRPEPSVTTSSTTATPTPAPVERRAPVRLRVLTFNIRYGSYGMRRVLHQVRRTRADVVVLNEIDNRTRRGGLHQARWLARKLGMSYAFDPNSPMPEGMRGNAVLTRHEIRSIRQLELPWPRQSQRRGVMQVRIAARGLTLDVWATHLNPGAGTVNQAWSVKTAIGVPTCATLLGGDINAGPGSREDRILRSHLRDVWRDVPTTGGPTNWQGDNRIDYLYVAHLRPRAAWTTPPRRASDHRGVIGVLDLDPGSSCG